MPKMERAIKDAIQRGARREIRLVATPLRREVRRLRHTVATEMLHAQASLAEVGQVLRHRSATTTAIYAKVDRGRLRELAVAWPQVSR